MPKPYFVFDTNCFISANLIKDSTNARAFDMALLIGQIALSNEVLNEYIEVLYRKKLDKYLNESQRSKAINQIKNNAIIFNPTESVKVCRDKKDNKFLELALACKAECVISGDVDLLTLHLFRSISILNPANFLASF